jgi:anti-sigma factor RsiW
MPCAESMRVQAYFDGEVDAPAAADIERHLEQCAECRSLIQDLERARTAVRGLQAPASAPPELRARILLALDEEDPAGKRRPPERMRWGGTQPFWTGALGGFGVAAAAASIAFLWVVPPRADSTLDALVSAHVRSLMPSHLIDVESTDRHTVKPWFAGHADVSPVVADFADRGFRLVGGRADFFDQQRAAVVVYQHGPHVINVFSWANPGRVPSKDTRNGYHLVFWREGNLEYCAVSDTSWDELGQLELLLQGLSAGDVRN